MTEEILTVPGEPIGSFGTLGMGVAVVGAAGEFFAGGEAGCTRGGVGRHRQQSLPSLRWPAWTNRQRTAAGGSS